MVSEHQIRLNSEIEVLMHVHLLFLYAAERFVWNLKIHMVFGSTTVLPAKSDSDVMFCLQSYQGLRIDRSLVY